MLWWCWCLLSGGMVDIRSVVSASRRARVLMAMSAAFAVVAVGVVFSVASARSADAASCSGTYLSLGSRGTCVKQLQTNLGGLAVAGVYGSGTQSRVRAFQGDTGLVVDDKVGPKTWAKLGKFGKALGWKYGGTLYMCKTGSRFQFSTWNTSKTTAYWRLFMKTTYLDGDAKGNRVIVQGTIDDGAKVTESLYVWRDGGAKHSTKSFPRSALPACG